MDKRTAVNKIGEVINLSQELNSMLWDRMYNGETYNDVKDLYYDICQLDVMSGIEIDKAKKEFDVNTSKELDKIREKYKDELSDEYNKKKIPHFFAHIARQKGYYNPIKKNYSKYNTSMDYLQTIVNGFRIKTPYRKDWLPFVSILDNSKFYSTHVNQNQINKVYGMLKKYISERKNIFGSDMDRDDKFTSAQLLYGNLIADIESESFGFSTLYRLLTSLEDKENTQIKNTLLKILYLCGNASFKDAIIHSSTEIEQLEEGGDDIKLFGIGYKITKKKTNSQKVV